MAVFTTASAYFSHFLRGTHFEFFKKQFAKDLVQHIDATSANTIYAPLPARKGSTLTTSYTQSRNHAFDKLLLKIVVYVRVRGGLCGVEWQPNNNDNDKTATATTTTTTTMTTTTTTTHASMTHLTVPPVHKTPVALNAIH